MEHNHQHAYLIMAHHNFEQLKILIRLLDDPRNDIYLHMDKKATDFNPETLTTKYANLYFVEPIVVTWGGHSQIVCEMHLFKNAGSKHYMYYHLLSGVDLPIKTQDEIHAFFQEHAGKNFMEIDEYAMETGNFLNRTQYYWFFQNLLGRNYAPRMRLLKKIQTLFIVIQKCVRFKRKEIIPLYKGANWVSITDELLQYILTCENLIKKQFFYSLCADEIFLQSIAMNSPYRDTIVNNYYREIDWIRGNPYTYRKEDVPQLFASSAFFARKFDMSVDPDVIDLITEYLANNKYIHD